MGMRGVSRVWFRLSGRSQLEQCETVWANLPAVYCEQATFYTAQYAVYTGVIREAQHKAITKQARKTNHIERFNNTLRQRVSRLRRDTLAFSKKLANQIGAIKYFICHYNLTRAASLPSSQQKTVCLWSESPLADHQSWTACRVFSHPWRLW